MRIKPLFVAVSAALAAATHVPASATDWLQFGYDTAHSSFNREERGYSTAGNTSAFNAVALSTPADSTPAFLGNVATPSGTKDLLFIVSLNGTLLAVDASNGSQVWAKQPATSTHITTGSPAIDPSLAFVYAYGMDGKVHKYQVGDGTEIMTGGWPEVSTLKPNVEKGASGLSFATANNSTTYLYSVVDG
jgi:outer membrane protein assembly factor BamB